MRSYVRYYVGNPEQLEDWINSYCREENVRVTAMTTIMDGGYSARILVAFETIKQTRPIKPWE